jgi:N6-L-threonylcarbamoyladenine synthase
MDTGVYGNVVSSQILCTVLMAALCRRWPPGNLKAIVPVVEAALGQAAMGFKELDAVAVTRGPGLVGSFLVGVSYAKALSLALGKPLIGVHHMEGHIMASFVEHPDLSYPFLALVVSGSHSGLIYVPSYGCYQFLGQSRDDAAGEAFDKIARSLGLPYPGGPSIQKAAREGRVIYQFPRALMDEGWDFSFSGLKSAVLNFINQKKMKKEEFNVADVAAAAQEAIVDVLSQKCACAAARMGVKTVVLAGGVAANEALRRAVRNRLPGECRLFYPSVPYCTDNAVMIGAAALEKYSRGEFCDYT